MENNFFFSYPRLFFFLLQLSWELEREICNKEVVLHLPVFCGGGGGEGVLRNFIYDTGNNEVNKMYHVMSSNSSNGTSGTVTEFEFLSSAMKKMLENFS